MLVGIVSYSTTSSSDHAFSSTHSFSSQFAAKSRKEDASSHLYSPRGREFSRPAVGKLSTHILGCFLLQSSSNFGWLHLTIPLLSSEGSGHDFFEQVGLSAHLFNFILVRNSGMSVYAFVSVYVFMLFFQFFYLFKIEPSVWWFAPREDC